MRISILIFFDQHESSDGEKSRHNIFFSKFIIICFFMNSSTFTLCFFTRHTEQRGRKVVAMWRKNEEKRAHHSTQISHSFSFHIFSFYWQFFFSSDSTLTASTTPYHTSASSCLSHPLLTLLGILLKYHFKYVELFFLVSSFRCRLFACLTMWKTEWKLQHHIYSFSSDADLEHEIFQTILKLKYDSDFPSLNFSFLFSIFNRASSDVS